MPDKPTNNSINAPQALFGTLFGVWYGNIVRDVILCENLVEGFNFDTESVKTIFVFGSLIVVAAFVILLEFK